MMAAAIMRLATARPGRYRDDALLDSNKAAIGTRIRPGRLSSVSQGDAV